MKILVIGGTIFLGRHVIAEALDAGHDVTMFNRGQHFPDLYPEVPRITGDRASDLGKVTGTFDAVLDTCGYRPSVVRAGMEHLAARTGHYTFVSSISVYAGFSTPNDESSPVGTLTTDSEEVTGETYGPLKAACERAVEDALPGRTLTVRPGLIVGPWDFSERFVYWARRLARGGEVLVPNIPDEPVRFIDGRDLAAWMLRVIEAGSTGVYNADGPLPSVDWAQFIAAGAEALGGDATPTWVDEDFLIDHEVQPWVALPMWVPARGDDAAFNSTDCSKAEAAGLVTRAPAATLADTLAWDRSRDEIPDSPLLSAEDEMKVLAAWAAR